QHGRIFEPYRLQVLAHAFAAALTPIATFTVATESAGSVEQIGAVDPHHAGLELSSHMQRHIQAFAPHTGRQAVSGVVGELDRFMGSAESYRRQYGAKYFLLGNN